jgi:hypothetical protein
MHYNNPVTKIIGQRFSCRRYADAQIKASDKQRMVDHIRIIGQAPFGTAVRFQLIAAAEEDRETLRGLGTYGFIRKASGYIVGAAVPGKKHLEDYGYLMERIVLFATDIGLGTCWLGGTFTKSKFARKISAGHGEAVPAIAAIGYIEDTDQSGGTIRRLVGGHKRLPWDSLFFKDQFGIPLSPAEAGRYVMPLDMVRLGPSASNKQPWRIIKDGEVWHFYLQRTKGYGNSFIFKLLHLADLQRIDMGIAMSHFELSARELGLKGEWTVQEPEIKKYSDLTEYVVSWIGKL